MILYKHLHTESILVRFRKRESGWRYIITHSCVSGRAAVDHSTIELIEVYSKQSNIELALFFASHVFFFPFPLLCTSNESQKKAQCIAYIAF